MDTAAYWRAELNEHAELLRTLERQVYEPFSRLVDACATALETGHKLLLFGNGGSAADAQHLATELTVRYRTNRAALSAIALTTDTSTLTAIGNDFGFDQLFSRQVDALCGSGDVVVGISTSGNSENVIRGVHAARARGATTAGLTGADGGKLRQAVDYAIVIPSTNTARIQEMHIFLGHMLCGLLEDKRSEPA